jgi:erythromycin esterase
VTSADTLAEIRDLADPLGAAGLDTLVQVLAHKRLVCIGEASHGTHEYYRWRAELSRRLIEERDFTWVGVEGDWPDCWRINRWVRGLDDQDLDAAGVLRRFERWPTWMWANTEVAGFLDWLHQRNLEHPTGERVGFYGLDVYSLWDSLRSIMAWLEEHAPDALPAARQAWQCFVPYVEDPHRYAWSARLVPESCEADVVSLLGEVGRRTSDVRDDEDAFDAAQNAAVAVEAEKYYRVMVRGDRESWNIRDRHMADTIDRVVDHIGGVAKGLVWEHNTHVGDARATDMASAGMVNVGQLVRERHGAADVALVGFAGHSGSVLAAPEWGTDPRAIELPDGRAGSHEALLHEALEAPAVLLFGDRRDGPWLSSRVGHRAIGVVARRSGGPGAYVPTVMGQRYDALIWLEHTRALEPLQAEPALREPELETEPTGL